MKLEADAASFLEALLWAYPEDETSFEDRTVFDFSPEFIAGVESFCDGFRDYLAEREIEIPESLHSFGGNVYFSLSGHGVGFWDSDETEHLQAHLEEYSGKKYRFEEMGLSEDENGNLDFSILPKFLPQYRAEKFTPARA